MKIAIFGATGGTGRCLLEQALVQGYEVTAFTRKPRGPAVHRSGVTVVQGDVLDPQRVLAAVAGQQAVLSALGTSRGSPRDVCSRGTKNIIDAMKQQNVRRLIVETAYGAGETREAGFYSKMLRIVLRGLMIDKDVQEQYIRDSGLEWVIVRPPRLTHGPKRGVYQAGVDMRMSPFATISRADVADFMLKQLKDDTYLGKAPGIRY